MTAPSEPRPGEGHYSGSPFLSLLNTELEEWRDGYARIGLALEGPLRNRSGVVHGGVLATLLDHAAGLSGLYCTVPGNKRYGMTLSLTTQFIGQAKAGRLIASGVRSSAGSRIFFAEAEVRSDSGVLLAKGSAVFRYRGGSESPEGVSVPPWALREER